jgi:DNA repair protein RadC
MKTNARETIKDLPRVERPRERLIQYGPEKLSHGELLAILLRSGKKGENVLELAHRIIKSFGIRELPGLTVNDLKDYPGLGPAKACEIVACFELGKRLLRDKKTQIYLTPKDVWEELKDVRNHKKEHFITLYLDSRNQEMKREIISIGSLNANVVHPREVFEPAVRNYAAHIIVAHNHPSGEPDPSKDDIEITRRLVEAGKILGIEVLDHIIVARNGFMSFKEKGLMP